MSLLVVRWYGVKGKGQGLWLEEKRQRNINVRNKLLINPAGGCAILLNRHTVDYKKILQLSAGDRQNRSLQLVHFVRCTWISLWNLCRTTTL
jgi:hypothetical protein